MADRNRRVRRQISDDATEDSNDSNQDTPDSEEEDFDPRRADAMRRAGRHDGNASTSVSPRAKRTSGGAPAMGRTTIQRSASNSSDDRKQSLKLTVKAPPSKLREVMRANEIEALQDVLGGGQVIDGPRRRRAAAPARTSQRVPRSKYAEYGESDIEDEDEDQPAEDGDDFSKIGAEAEGGTDDDDEEEAEEEEEDVEMEDAPMPPKAPKITLKPPAKQDNKSLPKPKLIVTPANVGPVKPVEDQEMQDDPGDEEVEDSSDLSNDDEDEDEDEEEEEEEEDDEEEDDDDETADQTNLTLEAVLRQGAGGGEDAQGEDEEMEDDEEGSASDSSEETPGSGAATPDPNKLTKRQRRVEDGQELMSLDMAPQQRKFFTDAEKAMKKDEHARKRKELTKRKIQEEKTAALNRLLKPQANKARGAAPKPETLAKITQEAGEASEVEEEYYERANPLYTRWLSTRDGVRLGVPEEWLGKRVGNMFGSPLPSTNGALVQEID